jgi:hypothetical protein
MHKNYCLFRRKLFIHLKQICSPDFINYLNAYEALPLPPKESLEISCELDNGIRVDSMRLAILYLQKQVLLNWLSSCHDPISKVDDVLFDNYTDHCFGIGLADYPSKAGVCRKKIYNFFGSSATDLMKINHIKKNFKILNISDMDFERDLRLFKLLEFSGNDWDLKHQPIIKVYYGPFYLQQLFDEFSEQFSKEEILRFKELHQKGFLSEKFSITARYHREKRNLRVDMFYKFKSIVPYLRIFDVNREVSKFLLEMYKIFPGTNLTGVSMQGFPRNKTQFYFQLK